MIPKPIASGNSLSFNKGVFSSAIHTPCYKLTSVKINECTFEHNNFRIRRNKTKTQRATHVADGEQDS